MNKMVTVKRTHDNKLFTSNMSNDESIYEIHFCTSYTQAKVYEIIDDKRISKDIICPAIGTVCGLVDAIAIQDDDTGVFI